MEKYITILDYSTGQIHIHKYTDKELEDEYDNDIEYLISELGYDYDNINYMCSDDLLLTIH